MFALAPLLPAIFAAGLASRHEAAPPNPALTPDVARHEWRAPAALKSGASVSRSADGAWIRIEHVAHPDPLVYWSAATASGTALPADARLLGTAAGPVRLPEASRTGAIVLYSLAHQQVIGSVRVENLP